MPTDLTRPSTTDRAEAGAAWLDTNHPGWANAIDLEELDTAHPHRCPLGQLYGDVLASPIPPEELAGLGCWTLTPGRDENARQIAEQEYELLDAAWEQLILARRGGAQ